MTQPIRRLLLVLLLIGIAASLMGISAVLTERQVLTRGALNGLPGADLPLRQPVLGVNAELTQYDDDQLAENLDLIKDTGFVWVRQVFAWDQIEPGRGDYDWSDYDRIVEAATERDLRLVAVLWRSPAWAASTPSAPPDDMDAFSDFVKAVAERYGDRIDVYQVWDEPNLSGGWGGNPPDAVIYTRMLEAAYKPIHAVDSSATVLTAGLAPTIERGPDNLSDVLYLRALYDNGAAQFFDGVAGKPYGFDTTPADRRVDEGLLNFSRMILLREEMERHGDQAKPLWASHFGWNSLPEGWAGDASVWGQASEEDQARWTVEAYERALTEWAWSGPLILEEWQPALPADDPHWGFALKRQDGSLSAAAKAITENAARFNEALWPGRYPAVTPLTVYGGQWEFSDLGADIVQDGGSVVDVPFSGGDLAVLARRGNYRAYLFVTVDGQESSVLPTDDDGRAYQVLASPDDQPRTDLLTLATVPQDGQKHTAHIVSERGWDQWAVAGFAVGWRPDTMAYDWMLGTLGMMAAVLVIVMFVYARTLEWPDLFGRLIAWAVGTLGQGLHLALAIGAALALWLGMALTWGGALPQALRRIGDGPSLALTALTAGVFYFSPWLIVTIVALVALFILVYSRPPVGLALIMAFTPYYLLPRPLFDRMFSLLEVLTLLMFLVWAIRFAGDRREKGWPGLGEIWMQMTLLDKAVAAFLALGVISISWAELKGVAFTDLRQMMLEPAVMYLVLRTMPLTRGERWNIIHLLTISGVVVAVYGYIQWFVDWRSSPGVYTCLRSVFGTCNNAALFLERIIPISAAVVVMRQDKPMRILYGIAGVLMLAAMVLSVSRGGLLFGLPVALALVLILWLGRTGVVLSVGGFVLEGIILIPLSMFVPRIRDMLDTSSGSSSSFYRTEVWRSTFQMLRDHPITGVGLDQFLYKYRGRYIQPSAWAQPNLSQPHNFLLDYWVRLGIFGLAAGIWLQIAFWRLAWKTQESLRSGPTGERVMAVGLMGAMGAMIAHGMVDETHFVIDLAFIFFMSLGLMHQLSKEAAGGNHDQRADAAAG